MKIFKLLANVALILGTATLPTYAEPFRLEGSLPITLSQGLTFERMGNNSRSCHEWCSNNLESSTGLKCLGAKLQVGEGWLDITCGGGPAVAGAVQCSCQARSVVVRGNNSRSCHDWCSEVSGRCVEAKLQVGEGWLDITCGGGPAVAGAVQCTCQ